MNTYREQPDSRRSWTVAFVGSIAMVFTFGTPLSYGIFQQPFSETFGISMVAISIVFSAMLFAFFIGSGLIGVFATQLPARGVLLGCAGVAGLIAPSLYFLQSYFWLVIVFLTLGLSLGTVFVLLASIIPRWFNEGRGVATGLIFVGNGLGLTVLPPIWQFAIANFGVRKGFLVLMSVTALAFAMAGIVCRRPLWADYSTASFKELLDWVRGLVGTRSFQLLFIGMGLAFAWYQLLAAYAIDFFSYRGLTEVGASTAFGFIGGISIISRIGGGYIADRVGSKRAFLASLCCSAVGISLLVAPLYSTLLLAISLIGLGLGGCATLYIPLLLQIYDPEKDTAIIGIFNIAGGIGALAMPPLGTATVAYTGNYIVAISLTVGIVLTSFLMVVTGTRNQ